MTWATDFRLYDPWIHPEDFMTALHARLDASQKRRSARIPEQTIYEDLFIKGVVNQRRQLSQAQIEQIMKSSADTKNFHEQLTRSTERGRSPIFDTIDILILRNWRELHLEAEMITKLGKLPGLRNWSPIAAEALFHFAKLKPERKSNSDLGAWFTKRRQRLDLPGRHRYKIKDLIIVKGMPKIVR